MAVFSYKGVDLKGRKVKGIIDAESSETAKLRLRGTGVFVTEIRRKEGTERRRREIRRVSFKDLSLMTYNLKTLLDAGLPLTSALEALVEQEGPQGLRDALVYIKEKVSQGIPLAQAIRDEPHIFPPIYVAMVEVGERSGDLASTMDHLSKYLDNQERIRSRILRASIYPLLMLLLSGAVLSIMMVWIIPRVVSIFEDMEVALPLPTRILIAVSSFMSQWWPLLLLLPVIGGYLLRRSAGTEWGREAMERLLTSIPIVGRLQFLSINHSFSMTMATLLRSGMTLTDALEVCADTVPSRRVGRALERVAEMVKGGAPLTSALRAEGLVREALPILGAGEKGGSLDRAFLKASSLYERASEALTEGLLSIIEPLLIITVGGIVGYIVISILLPILEMSEVVR